MVCKKCGYDGLIPNGDWLKCPHCGAEYFNTKINFGTSATTRNDKNLNTSNENNSEFSIKVKSYNKKNSFQNEVKKSETKTEITEQKNTIKENSFDISAAPPIVAKTENKANESRLNASESMSGIEKKRKKKNKKKKSKSQSKLKETVDFITPIVIAVIVALLLKTFVFANIIVPSGSMLNTISEGDRLIASRLSYLNEEPQRYDIIIFNFPDNEDKVFVKRIIGMPGEIINIVDGIAYVKDESGKISETDQSFLAETPKGNFGPYYIPFKNEIITSDGENCFAQNGMPVGKIEFLEKYCEKDKNGNYYVAENCYFCMGDNRNYSDDARYWNNTFVAQNKILGKVKFRYFPNYEKIE